MSDVIDVSDKKRLVFVDLENCINNTISNFLASLGSIHIVIEEDRFLEIAQLMFEDAGEQLNAALTTSYTRKYDAKNVIHDCRCEFLLFKKKLFKHKSLK